LKRASIFRKVGIYLWYYTTSYHRRQCNSYSTHIKQVSYCRAWPVYEKFVLQQSVVTGRRVLCITKLPLDLSEYSRP